jgi:hypothetical protein
LAFQCFDFAVPDEGYSRKGSWDFNKILVSQCN